MCKTQQKLLHKFNSFTPIKGETVSQAAQKNFYFGHDDKAEVLTKEDLGNSVTKMSVTSFNSAQACLPS